MKKTIGEFTIKEALKFCKQRLCWGCPFSTYCHTYGAIRELHEQDLEVETEVEK